MAISIRPARSEDAPELTALTLASKQSVGYDDAFMAACADELRVTKEQITKAHYWVAEDDDLLGCVRLEVNGLVGKIHAFFIHPDHQRKGIGRDLWKVVLTTAAAKKLTQLQLDSDPAAVPFYEAMGFKAIGEIPSGSIPGRMLPLMALSL